ncbi:MAG: hypothetical protein LAO77_23200 [Acidobacteriia bacterium]|nr:hypothetical protein [Terriglobia bacterium]
MRNADLLQCASCGGIYRPLQANGQEYFHACPARVIAGTKPNPAAALATASVDTPPVLPVFAAVVHPRNENTVANLETDRSTGARPVTDATIIAAYYQTQEEG